MKKGVMIVRAAASPQLKRTTVSAKIAATPYIEPDPKEKEQSASKQ
jgi:hypothetical protein